LLFFLFFFFWSIEFLGLQASSFSLVAMSNVPLSIINGYDDMF